MGVVAGVCPFSPGLVLSLEVSASHSPSCGAGRFLIQYEANMEGTLENRVQT